MGLLSPAFSPYIVRWNGQIDLIRIGDQLISLHGLAGVLKIREISEKDVGELAQRYPQIIILKNGKYKFGSQVYERHITDTRDMELIRLWSKTHHALLSFRQEEVNGQKRRIVGVHHAKTRKLVAEIELIQVSKCIFRPKRLDLSPQQASIERGQHFASWVAQSAAPPAEASKYSHQKGEIVLFKHGKRSLRINIGMYRLPDIEFRVSAREENGRKYVDVAYTFRSRKYLREFEIFGDEKTGWWADETPESRANMDALPDELRRLFTRIVRSAKPAPHR